MEWWRLCWDPTQWWRLWSDFMSCGACVPRRPSTRKEMIEELEKRKKALQDEIGGIDGMIEDLAKREAKHD